VAKLAKPATPIKQQKINSNNKLHITAQSLVPRSGQNVS